MAHRLLQAFYAVSVLATVIQARPYHRGVHEHWHHKRALVIQTITDVVMTTVEETTTVYYDATETQAPMLGTTTLTTITPAVATSAASDPAVVPETSQASIPETAATSSSPFSSPSEVGAASSVTPTSESLAPVSPATTSAAAPVAASSSSTTAAAAPSPSTSTSSSDSSKAALTGSSTATCDSTTAACSGDITYYTAGLGACGETSNGSTEDVLALPYEFMGTQSNGNPYCGKNVEIYNPANGKTAQGVVVDKCMGCTGRSIDLSNHLFDQLADESVGRVGGVVWYFTD